MGILIYFSDALQTLKFWNHIKLEYFTNHSKILFWDIVDQNIHNLGSNKYCKKAKFTYEIKTKTHQMIFLQPKIQFFTANSPVWGRGAGHIGQFSEKSCKS